MESQPLTAGNPRHSAMMMAMVVLILGAVFTAWCVNASFERGRLSSIPNYDDVVYFFSATRFLEAFRTSGLDGVAEIIHKHIDNLHSPYSTILAAAAFAVLGYHDSSPYIFNFIVILLYLFFLSHTLRDLPLAMRSAIMVCFLTLPFATMAVVEFRPDLCWAILIGFCAVFGISSRTYFDDWRQPAIHGMLFALSLLAKPSIFAMTSVVFGLSACCRTAMEWLDRRTLSGWVIARIALIYVVVTFLIAGPYFIFFGADIWNYFWDNLFGTSKAIWAYPGDWLHQFGYYLAGGAASNLGKPGWIIGCFFLMGTVAAIVRRDTAGMKLAAGLWVIVIATYLISSLAGMKSVFLGGAFYSAFIFGAACICNNALMNYLRLHPRSKAIWTGGLTALAVLSLMLYQWPQHSGAMDSDAGRNYRHVGKSVMNEISRLPLPQNPLMVFTQSGPVVWEHIAMRLLQQGLPIRAAVICLNRNMKEDFEQSIQDADIVFLQDNDMMGAFLRLPSESFQGQFRAILDGDRRFRLERKIETLDGKNVYLYVSRKIF